MERLQKEFPDVVIASVDVDEVSEVSRAPDISGIPDTRFYLHGEEKNKVVGNNIANIRNILLGLGGVPVELPPIVIPEGEVVPGKACPDNHPLFKFTEAIPT